MLRGLDAGHRSSYKPDIVKVADRERLEGTVKVYVTGERPKVTRRLREVRGQFELFVDAGVVPEVRFVSWPARISLPPQGSETVAHDRYETFRGAVGQAALDPFFERPDGETLEPPDLCIALWRDREIQAFYPLLSDGHVETVEEGLSALTAGTRFENVDD